ncbi:unnamed protein product [Urochloa humidicola]
MQYPTSEELSISKIKVKGFNLGGHQIDCRIWNDYNAKVADSQRGGFGPNRRCSSLAGKTNSLVDIDKQAEEYVL